MARMLNKHVAIESLLSSLFKYQPVTDSANPTSLRDELYQNILDLRCNVMDKGSSIQSSIFKLGETAVWAREIDAENIQHQGPQNKLLDQNYLRLFYAYLIAGITICEMENQNLNQMLIHELKTLKDKTQLAFTEQMSSRFIAESKGELISILK